ncbi:hypothetical protein PAECIP111892_04875 [Paenibacillus auburnensis]|uniref:Uncharacterized protein n=1 Tax=Paenibacillus auburnensis TaxID=2905649 RepID=A0ABM9CRJ9_9BACL|nr:daptide biosynthesis intramembrane metalloprotease [Paenibacillus auburnensis]CAH1220598.1 hypothetical protein PAECIP111892_04875 [Paenibacillus auburnensis]
MESVTHLEFHETENNYFLVQHISSHRFVKLGLRETEFLRYLLNEADGEEYSGTLTETEREYMTGKFAEWGFLSHPSEAGETPAARKWSWNWKIEDLTAIKFLTVNPDEGLTAMRPVIRRLLHPVTMVIYILIIATAMGLLVNDPSIQAIPQLGAGGYVLIYIMLLLTTVVHECAHGMVCKHYGGRVTRLGAMLFYFSPAMFCDVSDTYTFKKKRHKLAVLFAGIFSQWLMTSVAMILYYSLSYNGIKVPVLLYYGLANLGLSVLNMLPLVKLDGYWMLSHALGIVNLRSKAFALLFKGLVPRKRAVQSAPSVAPSGAGRKERSILLAYGLLASLFTPCFWGWGIYSIQQRLYSLIGAVSFIVTGVLCLVLLYHAAKFAKKLASGV